MRGIHQSLLSFLKTGEKCGILISFYWDLIVHIHHIKYFGYILPPIYVKPNVHFFTNRLTYIIAFVDCTSNHWKNELTYYVLYYFREHETYLHFLSNQAKFLFVLHSKYHDWWWLGDVMRRCISNHGIDQVVPKKSDLSTSRVKREISWPMNGQTKDTLHI